MPQDNIITIQISDEAKKYLEETAADATKYKTLFSEKYFGQFLKALYERKGQSFPDCTVENSLSGSECKGSEVYTLTPDNYENIILYMHGGAWVGSIGVRHIDLCDALATRLNAKVYMPLYPIAPQAGSKETYDMIETLYKEILKEGKPVYIAGDSAGGTIALGLMYAIKEQGLEAPQKMFLFAPCTDMTMSNKEIEEFEKKDRLLTLYGCRKCGELWAGKDNLKDPKNSALYADVTGYPDTILVQGTNDLLCPDNMLFYEKLKAAGVNVTLVIGKDLCHVFANHPIPERGQVVDLIKEFCLR